MTKKSVDLINDTILLLSREFKIARKAEWLAEQAPY
jgi:hypothetical protein